MTLEELTKIIKESGILDFIDPRCMTNDYEPHLICRNLAFYILDKTNEKNKK